MERTAKSEKIRASTGFEPVTQNICPAVELSFPLFCYLEAHRLTVQNSTSKHTEHEEKVKLDKEAHLYAWQNVKLDSCQKQSTWSMEITSFALNNFAPE